MTEAFHQGPRFSIMPGWVFTDQRVKPMDLKVLGILGRHIDKGGWCTRSQVKLAKELGVARSTVQSSLNRLRGIGIVQQRANDTDDGRDCSHDYRVLYDVEPELLRPDLPEDADEDVADISALEGDDTPADIPAPPADISAPPADPMDRHPIRTTPQERKEREARERVRSDRGSRVAARREKPLWQQAEIQKRVQRLVKGEGFSGGEWPKWAKSSIEYIAKQFVLLDEAEREAAERYRDAYLAKAKAQRTQPTPIALYLSGRQWNCLTQADIARAVAAVDRGKQGGDANPLKPDGWGNAYGPVWTAALFETLLGGPERPELAPPAGSVWLASHISRAWPRLAGLKAMADQRGGGVFPERLHRLSARMVFVPRDSAAWSDWAEAMKARGWPDILPARMEGGYFPAGGPGSLEDYRAALDGWQDGENGEERRASGAER